MNEPGIDRASTVVEYVQQIKQGSLTSEKLVKSCLKRIEETDQNIGAWTYLGPDEALQRAREMDDLRKGGKPLGPLHGIPVGVKDIFDTQDMPTANGSPIYQDRQPESDCAVVEKLKEAGAVILGKTATTEFAHLHPTTTRNPHNFDHTPGGSSSGSAAAVAANQVPLALGSQTGGSIIRPASFCGIYGYKPSRGIISRRGVFQTSDSLDQIGVFAQDPGDMALLCDVLSGYDASDNASYLAPKPQALEGYLSDAPIEPNFAWMDLPYASKYTDALNSGIDELIHTLGGQIDRIVAPQSFAVLQASHQCIYDYEVYRCLESERENHESKMSNQIKENLKRGSLVSDAQYQEAKEIMEASNEWFAEFFNDYDGILTPSSLGEAPLLDVGTGDPVCCTIWTLCGLPCLSIPMLIGENDLPMGVQLVGGYNEDDRLLRSTRWLLDFLNH